MFFLVSPAAFLTSVWLIRGGYRGAAPRAAGTGAVKYVLLLQSRSITPREQASANAHTVNVSYSTLSSREQNGV